MPVRSVTAIVAEALTEAFELLVAVTMCCPGWVPGVNRPAAETVPVVALPPLFPSTAQVTPPLAGSLVTAAANCCVCYVVKAERLGLTATFSEPWVTVIVAEAVLVLSATAVAVKVSAAGFGTFVGAL